MAKDPADRMGRERYGSLWRLAWPLIVSHGFWNLQLAIDRAFLGHFSTAALAAAIGVTGVFWAPMALLQETVAYLLTFVGQLWGAKDYARLGPVLWQALYISLIGGLLFLLLIPAAGPIFTLLGHSPEVQRLEGAFFAALCYAALPTAVVVAVTSFFSGLGQSRTILWIHLTAMVTNTIGAVVLIFGLLGAPRLGIAGAGYATAISSSAAAALGLVLLFRHPQAKAFSLVTGWHPNWTWLGRFLRFGLPSGLQWACEGLVLSGFLVIIGRMPKGDAALASSGICVTMLILASLPAFGFAQAVSVQVAQCLGAGDERLTATVIKTGVELTLAVIVPVSLIFACASGVILPWFQSGEPSAVWTEVATLTPRLLIFAALFAVFDSLTMIAAFALKGAGETLFISMVSLLLPVPLVMVPTWLVHDLPDGVFWAWGAATLYAAVQAAVFWLRVRGLSGRARRITEGTGAPAAVV